MDLRPRGDLKLLGKLEPAQYQTKWSYKIFEHDF